MSTDPPTLTAGQLAQFRGCESWNDCYFECCQSAQETIDAGRGGEIAAAERWAATQVWT
ncbi:hypothetical protein [Pseudonocardia sp. T1-2H]|uniref:hypothetical protein n=1 Tax=Pseudonocardia sp. T1-2H TaxID=3128899 RepID=UPI003101AEF0